MLKASPFDQKGVRGGFDGLEGHALQGGRVEHLGLEDMLAHFTVAAGFKKAGLPAARHEAEQRLVRRGHLDHHKVWMTHSHTSPWMSLRLVSRRCCVPSCAASSRAGARQVSDARALYI